MSRMILRKYSILLVIVSILLIMFTPLISGMAYAATKSWTSGDLCFNYGSECPDNDEHTLTFTTPIILTGASIEWISTGHLQPNESSTVDIEHLGSKLGSSGETASLNGNVQVTSVRISARHNGQGSAQPPDIAGSHKVRVTLQYDLVPTNTPIPTADQPCPNNEDGSPVRWIWDGDLGRDVPICEEIPVPHGDVDIITSGVCPNPEYAGADYIQISETGKNGVTTYVSIYDQAQSNKLVYSWADNDGSDLVYPMLPQGWYKVNIGVANDAQKTTLRTFYLTPNNQGEICVAAAKKYRQPIKPTTNVTSCLDYIVEIDAPGTQVVFPNEPQQGSFNGRSNVNVDFVITWPDGTVVTDAVAVTPMICPVSLPRTAEGSNHLDLWMLLLALSVILAGWVGRRFVRQ